jgi:hypothetical protein
MERSTSVRGYWCRGGPQSKHPSRSAASTTNRSNHRWQPVRLHCNYRSARSLRCETTWRPIGQIRISPRRLIEPGNFDLSNVAWMRRWWMRYRSNHTAKKPRCPTGLFVWWYGIRGGVPWHSAPRLSARSQPQFRGLSVQRRAHASLRVSPHVALLDPRLQFDPDPGR